VSVKPLLADPAFPGLGVASAIPRLCGGSSQTTCRCLEEAPTASRTAASPGSATAEVLAAFCNTLCASRIPQRATSVSSRLPTLPLAVAGPSQMIVQEADASPAVRKAAEALAALQLEHITTPERHPLPNQLAVLERTGIILRWACPHLGAEIEETVGAVVASLGEVPPAPTHRDLKLDHMLLDGDRPCLVDLDNFAEADPVIYVANGRSDAGRLS
jgi:hypothetical protein